MPQNQTFKYHVFLSHNSKDKPAVRKVKRLLAERGLTVWYDEDELQPGIPWQKLLEIGIESSASVAVLVGKDGSGPWEGEEMQGALRLAVEDKRPVIPVMLPGVPSQPGLPMFLGNRTWVDLRSGFSIEGIEKLIWGITGAKPKSGKTAGTRPLQTQRRAARPAKAEGGIIFAIGSGNLETLLKCEQRVTLGEKHEVEVENLWGGSAVNFSSRLLAAGLPVVPILAIGNDAAGRKICDELGKSAASGKVPPEVREYIRSGSSLMEGVETPTSTILVHGRERTIFRPKLQTRPDFNDGLKARVKAVFSRFRAKPTSLILGHIPSEGKDSPAPGECTRFILGKVPEEALVYGVFGSTQLAFSWIFWESLLSRVDVFQCNMEEAMRFFAVDGKKASLRAILDFLRKRRMMAVLTMDRFGAVAVHKGGDFFCIAWPLIQGEEVVDSTGAGDAFAAGMMSRLHPSGEGRGLSEAQFEKALHEGAIWAAAACTTMGGCGRDPRTELHKFRHAHQHIEQMLPERRRLETSQEVMNFIDLAYH